MMTMTDVFFSYPDQDVVRPYALVDALQMAGFRHARNTIILAFLGGSHQHGAQIAGKSDLDILGIYIEPPTTALGVSTEDHFTAGTSGQYDRNRPGDVDYKLYPLRRWAQLAMKGNPTVLSFLFTPKAISDVACNQGVASVWQNVIRSNGQDFLAASHATAFLGYGRAQLSRMQGLRGQGKHGQRPELEQEHGYDTKASMHLIRLMHEGLELLTTGQMTFPRPEKELLLSIRKGEKTQAWVEQEYLRLEEQVKLAEKSSHLPPRVNPKRISQLVAEAYLKHWKWMGYV